MNDAGVDAGVDAGPPFDAGMPPAAPTNMNAVSGNGQISLSWSPSATAMSYRLYWATGTTVTKATGAALPNVGSPFMHQGLTNGTSYAYVVTAFNASGESAASAVVTATPSASTSTAAPRILVTRPDADERAVFTTQKVIIRP